MSDPLLTCENSRALHGCQIGEHPRCAVLMHVYYLDLWPQLASYLLRFARFIPFDLWVNVVEQCAPDAEVACWQENVAEQFPGTKVFSSPNLGLDVGGTIALLDKIELSSYDLCCKLHTKRNPHNVAKGHVWRKCLLDALLGDPAKAIEEFVDPRVMMVGPQQYLYATIGKNREHVERLVSLFGIQADYAEKQFVAGTMFWCRSEILQRVKESGLSQNDFPPGWTFDGTLAHAMERVFGYLAWDRGILKGI